VEVEIVVQHDVEATAYMYQFLDEMEMWSLIGKNTKETGVLEEHNTKVSL
jgi:hypothetical protein